MVALGEEAGNLRWEENLTFHQTSYYNVTIFPQVHVLLLAFKKLIDFWGFPGGAVVKNPPANAGDTGSSPGPGRSHMPRSN